VSGDTPAGTAPAPPPPPTALLVLVGGPLDGQEIVAIRARSDQLPLRLEFLASRAPDLAEPATWVGYETPLPADAGTALRWEAAAAAGRLEYYHAGTRPVVDLARTFTRAQLAAQADALAELADLLIGPLRARYLAATGAAGAPTSLSRGAMIRACFLAWALNDTPPQASVDLPAPNPVP
jgi:hypothetical protein